MCLAAAENARLLGRGGSGGGGGGGLAGGLGARRQLQLGPLGARWRRFTATRHVRATRPDGAIVGARAAPVLPGVEMAQEVEGNFGDIALDDFRVSNNNNNND